MTTWYKTDINRLTYRELWRLSERRVPLFLLIACRKALRIPWPVTQGLAFPPGLDIVSLDDLPDRPKQSLGSIIAQARQHGLRFVLCHKGMNLGDLSGYAAVFVSADGKVIGNAVWTKSGDREEVNLFLGSRSKDLRLSTSNERRWLNSPPGIDAWRRPSKAMDELIAIHAARLDEVGCDQILPATEAEVAARVVEHRQRVHEFQLARGVYVPMTQEEVERLTFVMPEVVPERDSNPFRSPLADESPPSPRRPPSFWRFALNGACFGLLLGTLPTWLMQFWIDLPANPAVEQKRQLGSMLLSSYLLSATGGVFLGCLRWRRAKRQAAAASASA